MVFLSLQKSNKFQCFKKGETKKTETKEPTDDNHEVVYEAEAVIETFADDDHKFVGDSEPGAVIEIFADDALIRNFPKDEIQEIIGHDVKDRKNVKREDGRELGTQILIWKLMILQLKAVSKE